MFQISFHLDWQINNGIFNRPIMTCTQIVVHSCGSDQVFQHCFADGLNQGLVSSGAQAMLKATPLEIKYCTKFMKHHQIALYVHT